VRVDPGVATRVQAAAVMVRNDTAEGKPGHARMGEQEAGRTWPAV
jgi:hypothetical protein